MEYKWIISSLIEYYVIDVITFQGSIVTRGSHYDWQWHRRVRSRKTSAPHTTLLPPTETQPRWRHPSSDDDDDSPSQSHTAPRLSKTQADLPNLRYQIHGYRSLSGGLSLRLKPCVLFYDRGGATYLLSAQFLLAWDLKDSLHCIVTLDEGLTIISEEIISIDRYTATAMKRPINAVECLQS